MAKADAQNLQLANSLRWLIYIIYQLSLLIKIILLYLHKHIATVSLRTNLLYSVPYAKSPNKNLSEKKSSLGILP